MIGKFLRGLLALAAGLALLMIAVANPQPVTLALDPFNQPAALGLELPLFAFLFATLLIGVLLGGLATWLGQGHWRRSARVHAGKSMQLQAETDRLTRERERHVTSSKALLPTSASR